MPAIGNEPMQQKHVYYSGRVQGVGFRFTTMNIAEDYEVTGFVRNLPDGRVELLAQGPEMQLDAFLGELTATMGRHIIETNMQDDPCTEEFKDFKIRY